MCVVNKQFELLEIVINSVYINQKYNEIYLTFIAICVCACVVCVVMWSSLVRVWVPYVVGAVVTETVLTVVRVLLFVLDVSMLREFEDARVTAMLVWEV